MVQALCQHLSQLPRRLHLPWRTPAAATPAKVVAALMVAVDVVAAMDVVDVTALPAANVVHVKTAHLVRVSVTA